MKRKNSIKEYFLYIILKFLLRISNIIPPKIVVFKGKVLGIILYYLDRKHRKAAFKNLRMCLAPYKSLPQIKSILKKNFQNFGMSLMDILIVPKINKEYIQKNIEIQGLEYINEALKKKKAVILLGIHMGSWEVCFSVAGVLGLPFYILVEPQRKYPLLDKFLNEIRASKGVKIIYAGEARKAISILKGANILGLVFDHGIKEGIPLEFFGHLTHIPTLAIRLALDTKAVVIPGYTIRKGLLKHKIVLMAPLEMKDTENPKEDLIYNLKQANRIFETCIKENPVDYLWFYKRFKYNYDRTILFLEDKKAGHLTQLEALGKIIKEVAVEKGILIKLERIKIDFKNKFFKDLQIMGVGLARKSQCRECLWCLKSFLKKDCFLKINSTYADIVVSCGSSLAGVNFVVSGLNQAKSIVIMRPGILSTKRFDLVIMPEHDLIYKRKNILTIRGALSPIDSDYLKEKSKELLSQYSLPINQEYIGLLIGGNTKNFFMDKDTVFKVINQIKLSAGNFGLNILVTTSRRTPKEIEELIKEEFKYYSLCKFLVIANEYNPTFTVGGILGLSKIVVVSGESISMVSEAASSNSYVIVFKTDSDLKHRRFLNSMAKDGYIYLVEPDRIFLLIEKLLKDKPPKKVLDNRAIIKEAIEKIL